MTGLQRFPYARPRPALPCHPAYCPTCGYAIALEIHDGEVCEHCAGCARNRQRAELGLPPLHYERPGAEYELPADVVPRVPTAMVLRALAVVPRGEAGAQCTKALAVALGKCSATTHTILHDLERAGRLASFKRVVAGKSTRFWYVPERVPR